MPIFPDEIKQLLHVLFRPRSWRDTIGGHDRRRECLEQLAASGDVRLVRFLMPMAAADDALSVTAAGAIERLLRGILGTFSIRKRLHFAKSRPQPQRRKPAIQARRGTALVLH